jgi:hypothetical protein
MDNGIYLVLYWDIHIYKRRYDLCKSQLNLNIITTCVCIYIYGKMVVYIIIIYIHLYIYIYIYIGIYDSGRVLRLILSLLYYSYTITMNIGKRRKTKSQLFIYYQLILISRMNTYDNLYNLLTIIISERRCFNDKKETNKEC